MKHGNEATQIRTRRQALGMLGLFGTLPLVGCGSSSSSSANSNLGSTSTDATLSALTLSSGTLSPIFSSSSTSYTVSLSNAVASLTVTPTASSSGASITVNGTVVSSGSASSAIALEVGSNSITIVVTATDGSSTRTYTVLAVRASENSGQNCALIPSETQGPYPLLAILSNSSIMRQDITDGKTGVPLTVRLRFEDINNSCAAIMNAAIYIWHCDKEGEYSGYSSSQNGDHAGESFLRGVQLTDVNGEVTFTTIYPGWYAGRITHIHFQVYLNSNLGGTATVTSQLAFPQEVTTAVYNSSLYADKGQNTSVTSFAADNVFSDGTSYQMATLTGSVDVGYVAELTVGIAAS